MRKPSASCAKGVGALLLTLLAATPLYAGEIININPDGVVYRSTTNGTPSPWVEVDVFAEWLASLGDYVVIVDQRGTPPGKDVIADKVTQWADEEDQRHRPAVTQVYQGVVDDVLAKVLTIDDTKTEISARLNELNLSQPPGTLIWDEWRGKVQTLMRREIQGGIYSIKTLQSVLKGLKR